MRVTPKIIHSLEENEALVFGSNLGKEYKRPFELKALEFGFNPKKTQGFSGQAYGIPVTGRWHLNRFTIPELKFHVRKFLDFASEYGGTTFLVTPIAYFWYPAYKIAPLFIEAKNMENVFLPYSYWLKIGTL